MTNQTAAAVTDPFLFRFAAPRSAEPGMPGRYSPELGVWIVDAEDGSETPIIEVAGGSLVATQSKTMTHVEVDDDGPHRFGAMETSTFTRVRQEADDEDAGLGLPELMTKTDVQQERDDDTGVGHW